MSKKSRKEGNRVASLIKANKTEFYISDVDLDDNSKDVISCMNSVVKTLGKCRASFMLISAGTKVLTVVAYVPNELSQSIDHGEWINKSLLGLNILSTETENNYTTAIVDVEFPFKFKDTVRGNGFRYLSKKGLMEDDESSEEEYFGFDSF